MAPEDNVKKPDERIVRGKKKGKHDDWAAPKLCLECYSRGAFLKRTSLARWELVEKGRPRAASARGWGEEGGMSYVEVLM